MCWLQQAASWIAAAAVLYVAIVFICAFVSACVTSREDSRPHWA